MSQTTSVFAPRRLAHVNVAISDLERSVAFYRDVIGLHEAFREPALKACFLSNGNTHHDIALVEIRGAEAAGAWHPGRRSTAGMNHLAFEVASESDLVNSFGRCQEAGVRIHRTLNHSIAKSIYVHDVAGIQVEFYADTVSDWRAVVEEAQGGVITSHWEVDPVAGGDATEYWQEDPDMAPVEGALFPGRCVSQVALDVPDPEAAISFYTGVAGLRVLEETEDGTVLEAPHGFKDLIISGEPGEPGIRFFRVRLTEPINLATATESLTRAGIHWRFSPTATGEELSVWDPDGLEVRVGTH